MCEENRTYRKNHTVNEKMPQREIKCEGGTRTETLLSAQPSAPGARTKLRHDRYRLPGTGGTGTGTGYRTGRSGNKPVTGR